MSSPWIGFIFSITYGFPSVFLYSLTFAIIIRNSKSFSSSFFVLYTFDGVMNVFTYCLGFLTMRLTAITCKQCLFASFFKNIGEYAPLRFIVTMGYHMAFVQYSITTLVSLNRLSVLINYNLMEPIWKKYSWVFIVAIYFLPFLCTHVIFKYEAKSIYVEESQCYSIISPEMPTVDISAVIIVFTILATFLAVFVNISSICIVRNLGTQVKNKAETNFLVIMSITCAFQLLGTMITVLMVVATVSAVSPTSMIIVILRFALPCVSDGLSLVQPWLLICFSHPMRKQVKLFFGWKPAPHSLSNQMFQIRSVTN